MRFLFAGMNWNDANDAIDVLAPEIRQLMSEICVGEDQGAGHQHRIGAGRSLRRGFYLSPNSQRLHFGMTNPIDENVFIHTTRSDSEQIDITSPNGQDAHELCRDILL
jgi:hypothetical protein